MFACLMLKTTNLLIPHSGIRQPDGRGYLQSFVWIVFCFPLVQNGNSVISLPIQNMLLIDIFTGIQLLTLTSNHLRRQDPRHTTETIFNPESAQTCPESNT